MRKIRLIIILNMIILLSGCWDAREINELGMVTAVGIDKGEGMNKYSITVQIANPSSGNSSDGGSTTKNDVWIGTAEGESLFDATRKLVGISSRRIMWAHNNVVIIGESLAKQGIIPVIDYFTHNPELRMRVVVVIAKGDAKRYLAARTGLDSPSGVSFVSLERYRSLQAESVESNMLNVSSSLRSEYSNPIISAISLEKAVIQSENGENKGEESETISLGGAAVFKKDKMIGWLSPEETRGVSWIHNETKDTVVTVTDPEYGNKSVSVETKSVKADIKTEIVDGIPNIFIFVTGRGEIVEEDGSTNHSLNEVKENVATLLNKKIEAEIKQSLDAIQKKYKVDVLGFAVNVHSQNDREWHSGLKEKWEEVFPQLQVEVSANIDIKTSTLNQEPMKVQ